MSDMKYTTLPLIFLLSKITSSCAASWRGRLLLRLNRKVGFASCCISLSISLAGSFMIKMSCFCLFGRKLRRQSLDLNPFSVLQYPRTLNPNTLF